MIDLRIKLQPKQKQFREAIRNNYCTAFGGARGGGKSYALRNIFLIRRFEYPKSVGVIFRRTYPELIANHIQPMFNEHPELRTYWNESKKILSLPNGSTLQFSHCSNDNDLGLHQGKEWHDFGFDEAGQITESMFRTLQGSNRTSNPNIPARTAISLNPGGLGHGWVKRLFIDKRYNERERPQDYHFIQSLIKDNKALTDNDPDYVHRLNAETSEVLRKAYLYGDWDLLAGMFYSELIKEIHFIDPFEIPNHWNRFGGYDFGYNHPGSVGWFANDEDGNTFLYREYVEAGKRVDEVAEEINKYPESNNIYFIAGHDCWAKRSSVINKDQGNPPTIAEEFLKHDIHLKHAVIDRIAGAAHLRSYLAPRGIHKKPRFYIFNTCPISYDCLSRMVHDPNRAEDVLKQDAVGGDVYTGDDPYDMIRYALMSRPVISDPLPKNLKWGSPEWTKKEVDEMESKALEHFQNMEEMAQDPFRQ